MDPNIKLLSLADARLGIFTETEADLKARFLELMELREQLREAQLAAGSTSRGAWPKLAAGYACGEIDGLHHRVNIHGVRAGGRQALANERAARGIRHATPGNHVRLHTRHPAKGGASRSL